MHYNCRDFDLERRKKKRESDDKLNEVSRRQQLNRVLRFIEVSSLTLDTMLVFSMLYYSIQMSSI